MKRHRMAKGHSKRTFTRAALNVHPKNMLRINAAPMRGGIRL